MNKYWQEREAEVDLLVGENKIDIELLMKVHTYYSANAVIAGNNMPPDSFTGFIGWLLQNNLAKPYETDHK